jgi:hypothetical protein
VTPPKLFTTPEKATLTLAFINSIVTGHDPIVACLYGYTHTVIQCTLHYVRSFQLRLWLISKFWSVKIHCSVTVAFRLY